MVQLAELLGVKREQATRLAAQNVSLLGMDASGWELKVTALAAALRLSRAEVVKMLARMPSLLGLRPKRLAERLVKMAAKLNLPKDRVRMGAGAVGWLGQGRACRAQVMSGRRILGHGWGSAW